MLDALDLHLIWWQSTNNALIVFDVLQIIVGLTNERHPDPELVYALLLTYKSHISAASLLEKLIARFYLPQLESTTDEVDATLLLVVSYATVDVSVLSEIPSQ